MIHDKIDTNQAHVMQSDSRTASDSAAALPLTMPTELWAELKPPTKAVYRAAQEIIDYLRTDTSTPTHGSRYEDVAAGTDFSDVARAIGGDIQLFASATQLLSNMDLVAVGLKRDRPLLRLIALPEEHIRVRGPDGAHRWVFVARPLEAPEVDPAQLN